MLKKFNFEENANGLAELDRLYTETKKRWESAQERIRTQEKEGRVIAGQNALDIYQLNKSIYLRY